MLAHPEQTLIGIDFDGTLAPIVADPDRAHAAVSFGGGYLAAPNVGLLGSHANTALPLAATLLAWGRTGIAARIEPDMAVA